MKIIKMAKWLSGDGNSRFAKLLIGYNDGEYEVIKFKLSGASKVTHYEWHNDALYDDGIDPHGIYCSSTTFRPFINISQIINLNKTNGHKKIKELEEKWRILVENCIASYDKAKADEAAYKESNKFIL